MGEPFEAEIKRYTEALAADPKSRVFVPLSDIYRKLGRYDEAIVVAREGLARNPHYMGGKVALARALFENGDLLDAEPLLAEVLNFASDNLLANRLLAQVYLQSGRRERAVPLLKRLHAMDPGDTWAAGQLAEAPVVKPAHEVPKARPAPPGPEQAPLRTATLAELYRSQGHRGEALEIYRELLRADPKNAALARSVRELEDPASGRAALLEKLLARVAERRRKAA